MEYIEGYMEKRVLAVAKIFLGIVVSCYFFPFEFTFLPKGLNTKIMMAVFGVLALSYHIIRSRNIQIDKELLPSISLAVIFSLVGYISVDINNSNDYAYATYFISFGTWILGAYSVYRLLKVFHNYVGFKLIVQYLVAVSVVQCCLAIGIDNIPSLKTFVDTYISQDTIADVEFLKRVNRLYGIGAALDPAGTRFSVVLLSLAAVLVSDIRNGNTSNKSLILYWSAFVVISVIGNMISRTTTVGMAMGLGYILFGSKIVAVEISNRALNFWKVLLLVSVVLLGVAVYFYNAEGQVRGQLRFAFEGFFNWVEKGEWRTDSTDRLNSVMWIWPEANDLKTWIIGKADFSFGGTGTDIGYCRFIFYSGLIGLIVFSVFFIYNAMACIAKFPEYKYYFLSLLALGFIIWLKIPTDLFLIYALFFCIDKSPSLKEGNIEYENSLHH